MRVRHGTSLTPIDQGFVEAKRARMLELYGDSIGRTISDLITPALVLDLPAAQRNIDLMADRMKSMASALRPHVKVHKSPALARLQVDCGAAGLSVATVWEALTMVSSGLDDIFIVNTVAGSTQMRVVARLAREHRILVAVDDLEAAEALNSVARGEDSTVAVIIEVDTGMDRAGTDTEEATVELARGLARFSNLRLEGLTGYEGHCSLTPDRDERKAKHGTAMQFFADVIGRLTEEGFDVRIRSAGGTATWEWTAAYPGISEIQAGSYVVMDNFHGRMIAEFDCALTVATTVISRPPDGVIVDAGSKSVGAPNLVTMRAFDLEPVRFDEEHGIFDRRPGAPDLGQVVELIPGYAPSTVNMYDAYHVVDEDEIVDIWPVIPRGPGHVGLAAYASDDP